MFSLLSVNNNALVKLRDLQLDDSFLLLDAIKTYHEHWCEYRSIGNYSVVSTSIYITDLRTLKLSMVKLLFDFYCVLESCNIHSQLNWHSF